MNILATSGGFISDGRRGYRVGAILEHALSLAGSNPRPRLCFVNTASGDDVSYYEACFAAVNRDLPNVRASKLSLFSMPNVDDIRSHLLSQDVIWVGGGSVANLLAVWKAHGVDEIMRDAWRAGVVLGGVSAGSLCWHVGGTTDSFGPDLRPITNGLALLPYSNTPHYDSEERRRPAYQALVADGTLPPGWATDDGVGLHFRGTDFVEAIAEKPNTFAWRVEQGPKNTAVETKVVPRYLMSAAG